MADETTWSTLSCVAPEIRRCTVNRCIASPRAVCTGSSPLTEIQPTVLMVLTTFHGDTGETVAEAHAPLAHRGGTRRDVAVANRQRRQSIATGCGHEVEAHRGIFERDGAHPPRSRSERTAGELGVRGDREPEPTRNRNPRADLGGAGPSERIDEGVVPGRAHRPPHHEAGCDRDDHDGRGRAGNPEAGLPTARGHTGAAAARAWRARSAAPRTRA